MVKFTYFLLTFSLTKKVAKKGQLFLLAKMLVTHLKHHTTIPMSTIPLNIRYLAKITPVPPNYPTMALFKTGFFERCGNPHPFLRDFPLRPLYPPTTISDLFCLSMSFPVASLIWQQMNCNVRAKLTLSNSDKGNKTVNVNEMVMWSNNWATKG